MLSQQTMAASYANVVQTYLSRKSKPPDVQDPNDDEIDNPNTVKPIFLQDQDMFGHLQIVVLLSLLFLLYLVFVLQDFWDFVCEILHVYLSSTTDKT
jgi:hypothetical protein